MILAFFFKYTLSTPQIFENSFGQIQFLQNNQSECTYDANYTTSLFFYNTVCLIRCRFNSIQSDSEGGAVTISLKTQFGNNNYFHNCTFTDCKSKSGSALYIKLENQCTTEINNCIFQRCKSGIGGSIYMNSNQCNTSLFDCIFERNTASSKSGGSIYIYSKEISYFNFTKCLFKLNLVNKVGGAIYFHSLNASFDKCKFTENTAASGGGSIASSDSYILYKDCLFDKNKVDTCANGNIGSEAFTCGGAVLLNDENVTFERCNFTENFVKDKESKSVQIHTNFGGAIKISCNYGRINECLFDNNKVISLTKEVYGGAISDYVLIGNSYLKVLNLSQNTFINNKVQSESEKSFGGAISFDNVNAIFVENNFINNKVCTSDILTYGGAIYLSSSHSKIYRCNFINNLAETKCSFVISDKKPCSLGGAAYIKNSKICFAECSFINNTGFGNSTNYISTGAGGAIYCSTAINLTSCTFNNNTLIYFGLKFDLKSKIYGGSCYFSENANLFNCSFINNTATLRSYEISNHFCAEIYGGAIYHCERGTLNCSNCSFLKNLVSIPNHQENEFAGAVFLCKGLFDNCNFIDNIAYNGCDINYEQTTYIDNEWSFNYNPSISINNTIFKHNSIINHQIKSLILIHANSSHSPINIFTNNKVVSEISAVLFDGKIEKIRRTNKLSIVRFIIDNNCMSPYDQNKFISDDFYFYNVKDNRIVTFDFAFHSDCNEKQETSFIQIKTQTMSSFTHSSPVSIPAASSFIAENHNNDSDIELGLLSKIMVLFFVIMISQVVVILIIIFAFIVILNKRNNDRDIDPLLVNE